jgi:hypothetical protein
MLSFKQFLLESISDRVKNINKNFSELERISGGFQPGIWDLPVAGPAYPYTEVEIGSSILDDDPNTLGKIFYPGSEIARDSMPLMIVTKSGLDQDRLRQALTHELGHLANYEAQGFPIGGEKGPVKNQPRGKKGKVWKYELLPTEKTQRAMERIAGYWKPEKVNPVIHGQVAKLISQGKTPQEALNMTRHEVLKSHLSQELHTRSKGRWANLEAFNTELEKRMKQGNFPKEVFKTTSLALQQAETGLPDLNDPSVRDEFLRQHGYGAKGTSTGTTKPPVDVTPSVPVKPKGMSPGTKLGVATAAIAPIVALSQGANAGEAWEATKQSILDPSNYNPLSILDSGKEAGRDSDGTPRPGTPAYDDYQKELARQEMGYRSAEAAKRRAADAERFKQAGFASNPLEPIRKTK